MTEEWFDVVDDEDVVTGRATRREVHARGWRHRAVHVLVFNRAGEVFLQKRSMRELREEIGVRLERAPRRCLRLQAGAETGQEFVWVYRLEAEGPFTLHPEEIEEGAWFAPGTVAQLVRERPSDFASSFRLIWRELAAAGQVPA